MKKQWMYFIAGAGLMAAVMSFMGDRHSTFDECRLFELRKMAKENKMHFELVNRYCKEVYDIQW